MGVHLEQLLANWCSAAIVVNLVPYKQHTRRKEREFIGIFKIGMIRADINAGHCAGYITHSVLTATF